MSITPQEALVRCIEHREIFHDEMLSLFRRIMGGEMSPLMIAALTMGLRVKKETVGEIAAAAQVLREFSVRVATPDPGRLLDIVGTGGDGAHTFNISTAAMFVAAACGAQVAKHGGRSVSSSSGSADLLEALGVNIHLPPQRIAESIEKTGIGFMYAPNHHAAMKHAQAVRRELGVRTIFNILGPLTNPAMADNVLMGVFHPDLVGIQIRVLRELGVKRALVVWGRDNLDEISLGASTLVGELSDGQIREYDIHPEDFGIHMVASRNFEVKDAEESKKRVLEGLSGQGGPATDIIVLNAAAALYTVRRAASIAEGLEMAREAVASGAALARLEAFAAFMQEAGMNKEENHG